MLGQKTARKLLLVTAGALTVGCGQSPTKAVISSAYEPHRAGNTPWFEGWYTRITDLGGERSLAVIVATQRPRGGVTMNAAFDPGYIGVLYSEGNGAPTLSWTFMPTNTRLTVGGHAVNADPNPFNSHDSAFQWEAKDFGFLRNDVISITVPGQLEVEVHLGEGTGWDSGLLPLGPESYWALLPIPLHWYVKSLNSPANYRIKMFDSSGAAREINGQGEAHLEKNWGQSFPKAWNWLQALSVTDNAQLVLSGGSGELGGTKVDSWLAGYRSDKEKWDLRSSDLGTKIAIDQGPCQGPFHFRATRLDLEVEIRAEAPLTSFGEIAGPTVDGFVPKFGAESFSAIIEVKTYRHRVLGRVLTDRRIFQSGALEFGAGSYHPGCSRSDDRH